MFGVADGRNTVSVIYGNWENGNVRGKHKIKHKCGATDFVNEENRRKKNSKPHLLYNMTKIKWSSQWLFVSIAIILNALPKLCVSEQSTSIPPLECYDKYGRPQVNFSFFYFLIPCNSCVCVFFKSNFFWCARIHLARQTFDENVW